MPWRHTGQITAPPDPRRQASPSAGVAALTVLYYTQNLTPIQTGQDSDLTMTAPLYAAGAALRRWQMLTLVILTCLLAPPLQAEVVYYRYKDANGMTVLGSSVPPELARQGYQVVNIRGRVIREIAPALTEDELAEKERLQREAAEARRKQIERREQDRALLQLYRTPADAERARDRRLQELDALIQFKKNHLSSLSKDLSQYEAKAAEIERLGRQIPQAVLIDIDRTQKSIGTLETEIMEAERQATTVNAEFVAIISRLQYLQTLQSQ
tara:strand:- start:24513 stop:25319 length:807 start_codon:yes stop_codon:yes gene_type:complete